MKKFVKVKSCLNSKQEERYLIEDTDGNVLHMAGGSGFKTVETAEKFARSHQWTVVDKPTPPEMNALF